MKMIFSDNYLAKYRRLSSSYQQLALITQDEILEAEVKEEIFQLKAMRQKDYYSINIGESYRIGVKIKGDEVMLLNVGHRETIYNNFP